MKTCCPLAFTMCMSLQICSNVILEEINEEIKVDMTHSIQGYIITFIQVKIIRNFTSPNTFGDKHVHYHSKV